MRTLGGLIIAFVLCMPFGGWMTFRIVKDIQFDRNMEGHLKRAADANTVHLAEKELAVAIAYLTNNQMTSGYTSVLYNTPDEDVGFLYTNLTESLEELHRVPEGATQLETSNILIKLRETLLDYGQSVKVTLPEGISVFPYNALYFFWGSVSMILAIIGVIVFLVVVDF